MPDMYMDVDAGLAEVPVNLMPLIDDTDFKTVEDALAYNAAGMDLRWNFVTSAGAYTSTAVTPTSAGDYDWAHQGDGMYSIEIPASGGASINNDTEGYGWFTGKITGVLPFRGPVIGFRASGLNDLLCDSAYSATRGLAGTALPAAAADAAGGLPISDAGGLDLDAKLANTNEVTVARMGALTDLIDGGRLDLIIDAILVDTGTTLNDKIDTIDGIVDSILVDTAEIGAAGAGLSAVPWNAAWDAEVQSEVDDALIAKGLDHLVFASVSGTDIADNSIIAKLVSKSATADWDTFDNTTDSLEANRDNIGTAGASLTAADDAVITLIGVAGAGLTDLGGMSTTMKAQVEAEVDDALGSGTGTALTAIPWNAAWDTEVQSEVDDALVAQRLDELLNADSDIDGAAPPTVGSVFHELMTKTAGSFTFDQTTDSLEALRDRGDAAWITATGFSTHTAADVWSVATRVLTAGTNIQLPSNGLANVTAWTVDITGSLSGSVGSVTGAVGSVTATVSANAIQISGDTTAADNLEAFFDGTGYNAANSTVGTVSTVTLGAGAISASTFATGAIDADALENDAVLEIADALLDRSAGVETGLTPRQALRLMASALGGKLSGGGTTTNTIRDYGDTKNRIVATVDNNGNRSAITFDLT